MESSLIQDAVTRRLQTMAESTQRLSDSVKNSESEVDWKAISGLRNILVHDYFGLDPDLIWRVAENRLPELLAAAKRILNNLNK